MRVIVIGRARFGLKCTYVVLERCESARETQAEQEVEVQSWE